MTVSRKKVTLIIVVVGVIMTIFAGALTTMAYRKVQAETRAHAGVVNTASTVKKLNYSLGFGKPLNKFYGLDELIEGIIKLDDQIKGVEVVDADNNTVKMIGDISEHVKRDTPDDEYIIKSDGIYAFVPFDSGELVLRLGREGLDASVKAYIEFVVTIGGIIVAGIFFVTVLICLTLGRKGITIKRMRIISIIVLVVSQLILGGLSMYRLDSEMVDSFENIAYSTAKSVENDINEVIAKGVHYDEIKGVDLYLQNFALEIPEISGLMLYESMPVETKNSIVHEISIEGAGSDPYYVKSYYSNDLIRTKRVNSSIDVFILALITIFISMEAVNFLTKNMEYRGQRQEGKIYIPGFRLFIFAEGIAFALDSGFFAVFSNKMYEAMELPDSMSFLGGMPNTMYSLAVLIGLFGCGSLIKKIGMKKTLIAGIMSGIIGYVFCALSPNLIALIVARFIFGFCDGIIINAVRLFAASQEDKEMHNRLLVEYMAAINLGVSCGVVIGGLVADAASYSAVFILGAVIGVFCLFLIFIAGFPEKQENEKKMSLMGAIKELKNPQVLVFMIFVVTPLYMASLFVQYTFPLFGDEMHFSNSLVSGLLMLNFMIIAYLTDPISDWVIKRMRNRQAMFSYMVLQTMSIGLFVFIPNILTAILALVFTSIWDCFGMVVIDSALDNVEGTTTEQSTLLQMIFGKIAMVIGPVAITARLYRGAAKATGVIVAALALGIVVYGISLYIHYGRGNKSGQDA